MDDYSVDILTEKNPGVFLTKTISVHTVAFQELAVRYCLYNVGT